jgi:hypothetical protein
MKTRTRGFAACDMLKNVNKCWTEIKGENLLKAARGQTPVKFTNRTFRKRSRPREREMLVIPHQFNNRAPSPWNLPTIHGCTPGRAWGLSLKSLENRGRFEFAENLCSPELREWCHWRHCLKLQPVSGLGKIRENRGRSVWLQFSGEKRNQKLMPALNGERL